MAGGSLLRTVLVQSYIDLNMKVIFQLRIGILTLSPQAESRHYVCPSVVYRDFSMQTERILRFSRHNSPTNPIRLFCWSFFPGTPAFGLPVHYITQNRWEQTVSPPPSEVSYYFGQVKFPLIWILRYWTLASKLPNHSRLSFSSDHRMSGDVSASNLKLLLLKYYYTLDEDRSWCVIIHIYYYHS
jgi:hypothetical protein